MRSDRARTGGVVQWRNVPGAPIFVREHREKHTEKSLTASLFFDQYESRFTAVEGCTDL